MATTKVEYFANGQKIGERITSPFNQFTWQNAPVGTHEISTKLYDNGQHVATSPIISITVNAITDVQIAPVAYDDTYTTEVDTTLSRSAATGVLSNDTDDNADTLTAELVTAPTNGTLTLNSDGSFEYVPNAGYIGADSFVYRAFDGTDYSDNTNVNINVEEEDNSTYSPQYQAVLDYATSNAIALPSVAQRAEDDTIISAYVSSGRWDKESSFYKFKSTAPIEFRLIDMKRLVQAEQYGNLTWTDDEVIGDGSTGYIDLKAPLSSLQTWSLNDAGVALYVTTISTTSSFNILWGVLDGTNFNRISLGTGSTGNVGINAETPINTTHLINVVGLLTVSRINNIRDFYTNGNGESNEVLTQSSGISDDSPYLFARHNAGTGATTSYTNAGVSYCIMGASMENDHNKINGIIG